MADLWERVPDDADVCGVATADIYQGIKGKPVIRIEAGGRVTWLTANVVEMLGGVATGARKRWEDHNRWEGQNG